MRSDDLTAEQVERYADGELAAAEAADAAEHVRSCARCAAAVLDVLQMKRLVRDSVEKASPPAALRSRVLEAMKNDQRGAVVRPDDKRPWRAGWWVALAAVLALGFVVAGVLRTRGLSAAHELADMHATLLSGANPVDVLSTDKHTVKPWFEGRVPFAVPVPELASTPFHLIGGRVVFWRSATGAYLLVGKGAHRISVFVFPADSVPAVASIPSVSTLSWRSGDLSFVAVADVPVSDLVALRNAWR